MFYLAYPTRFSHSGRISAREFQTISSSLGKERKDSQHACKKKQEKFQALSRRDWYPLYQSHAVITNMADFSNNANKFADKQETVSKGVAKRKYLLLDDDLEGIEFELKDNPVNKGYG